MRIQRLLIMFNILQHDVLQRLILLWLICMHPNSTRDKGNNTALSAPQKQSGPIVVKGIISIAPLWQGLFKRSLKCTKGPGPRMENGSGVDGWVGGGGGVLGCLRYSCRAEPQPLSLTFSLFFCLKQEQELGHLVGCSSLHPAECHIWNTVSQLAE